MVTGIGSKMVVNSDELGKSTLQAILLPCSHLCPETKLFFIRLVYFYDAEYFNGATRDLAKQFGLTDLVINRAMDELTVAGLLAKRKVKSGTKGRPRIEYRITDLFFSQTPPNGYTVSHSFQDVLGLVIGIYRCGFAERYQVVKFLLTIKKILLRKIPFRAFEKNFRTDLKPIERVMDVESQRALAFQYFKVIARMKSSMRLLLVVLIACANRAGLVEGVTIKQLMNLTGMTKKRLMQHMTELVKQEYIRRFVPDYVGAYSPLKDRTGICLLNLCNANFEKAGVAQVGFVALLPPEFPVSAQLDAAAFKELDQSHRQYVGQVLQLYTPKDDHDHDDFLMQDSKLDIDHQVQLFKKMIVKQAQLPAALRLFEQLNEGLVQFLLLKLDQLAFEIIRQRWSNYQFETDYQKFVRRNQGEWTQRLTPDSTELGELIWAVAELKAWRYIQFIASGKHSVFHVCVPSGFTPHEQNRVGFILTTHHHQCGAYFPIRFQQSRPNRQWSTLIDRKEIEQVKRDYGFLTKSGLTDEERRRVYSSFMDG